MFHQFDFDLLLLAQFWIFSVVDQHMILQFSIEPEGHVAVLAFVRILPNVNSQVLDQIIFLGVRTIAKFTVEGLFSCMNSHMPRK
jgi:phosphopantetheine adenylyltransferase